jgi:60 kDa SS-A/Ro ribonucleoprotein
MTDPLRRFSTRSTPQTQPDPTRSDQVRNSAGGYGFRINDMQRLRRFLVLGTDGGTYYASEQALTKENAQFVIDLVNRDRASGICVVDEVRFVSIENVAPRQKATLFTLAIAASSKDVEVRRHALAAVPEVCRTGTMLFNFVEYAQQFRGWGPSLRKEVARWYNVMPLDKLALQVVKYRQRDGWTHRDVMRKVHPTTTDERRNAIYRWVTHRDEPGDVSELPILISAYEAAQVHGIAPDVIVALIENAHLPWEAIPDEHLRHPAVMEALVPRMGLTALTRQLGRMASTGHLTSGSTLEKLVLERLRVPNTANERFVGESFDKTKNPYVQARVHPFQMLLALTTYQSGQGVRGKLTWNPTSRIVDALDAGFYAAFGSLPKSDKRTLVALDVSGSMGWSSIANTHITPRVGSAAMAMVTMASTDATIMAFGHELHEIDISPRQRLDDVVKTVSYIPMGGTDCALPMVVALQRKLMIDTFVVYTDNETWAGHIHPHQALRRYREEVNPEAKLVVVGMTATGFTIADPHDPGMMDVVGFDASAPRVIQDFGEGLTGSRLK